MRCGRESTFGVVGQVAAIPSSPPAMSSVINWS
jgi:hypothetical protein